MASMQRTISTDEAVGTLFVGCAAFTAFALNTEVAITLTVLDAFRWRGGGGGVPAHSAQSDIEYPVEWLCARVYEDDIRPELRSVLTRVWLQIRCP